MHKLVYVCTLKEHHISFFWGETTVWEWLELSFTKNSATCVILGILSAKTEGRLKELKGINLRE